MLEAVHARSRIPLIIGCAQSRLPLCCSGMAGQDESAVEAPAAQAAQVGEATRVCDDNCLPAALHTLEGSATARNDNPACMLRSWTPRRPTHRRMMMNMVSQWR